MKGEVGPKAHLVLLLVYYSKRLMILSMMP